MRLNTVRGYTVRVSRKHLVWACKASILSLVACYFHIARSANDDDVGAAVQGKTACEM